MDFGMVSLFVRWIMASDLISTSFFFGDFFGVFFCVFSIDTKGISITGMLFSYQVDIFSFLSTSCTPELLEYFCSVNHQKWRFIKSK